MAESAPPIGSPYGGKGPVLVRVGWSLGAVTTLLMILRIYVRLRINKKTGGVALAWALVAYCSTILAQSMASVAVHSGLGNHIEILLAAGTTSDFLFYTWMCFFFFLIAIAIGKAAVCAFLLELQGGTNQITRIILYCIALFNILATIPLLVINWTQCSPSYALWDPILRSTHCPLTAPVTLNYTYFLGAVAAVSDFALALMPIRIIWPLQMDWKIKAGLCFLMGTGVVAGVAAIIRSYNAQEILAADGSYQLWKLFLWGEIEEWLVLICMSIPPVWPLFRPYLQSLAHSTWDSKTVAHTTKSPPPLVMPHRRSSRFTFRSGTTADPSPVDSTYTHDSPMKPHGSLIFDREPKSWMELDEIAEERSYKPQHLPV